jgi:hypothetical protein
MSLLISSLLNVPLRLENHTPTCHTGNIKD